MKKDGIFTKTFCVAVSKASGLSSAGYLKGPMAPPKLYKSLKCAQAAVGGYQKQYADGFEYFEVRLTPVSE